MEPINGLSAAAPERSVETTDEGRDYKIKLPVFEGPLDLLLFLIKRDEIDISDIPVARITSEYLEYIRAMQELDIDVAGEFLVMAATLINIKSKLLLPVTPVAPGEEAEPEDPRADLVRRLIEHQRYKSAAQMLWAKAEVEQAVFLRPTLEPEDGGEIVATVFDLLETFRKILERRREHIEIEIARDEVTQAEKMTQIRELVETRPHINVRELFEAARSRREMVCIFLAVLELVKELVVRLVQEQTFGDILVRKREPEPPVAAAVE